jgi:hypothetical protein
VALASQGSPLSACHLAALGKLGKRLVSAVSADTCNLAIKGRDLESDTMGFASLLVSRIPVALSTLRVEPPFALTSLANVGILVHRLHVHCHV